MIPPNESSPRVFSSSLQIKILHAFLVQFMSATRGIDRNVLLKRYTLIWSTTVISNLYVQYSTVWATGWMLRGFSLFHTRPDWPLVPLIFCSEYWGSFPRVKRPSCDVNLYTSSVLSSHVTGWVPHTRRINTRHKSLILLDRKLRY
jgi:hypothetical protein